MKKNNRLALYKKIYQILRRRILEGEYPTNKPMPGEVYLAKEFGVTRSTIRSAMQLLSSNQLISRKRGRGTFPKLPFSGGNRGKKKFSIDQFFFDSEIVSVESVQPEPRVARDFHLIEGEQLNVIHRMHYLDNLPFAFVSLFLRESVFSCVDLNTIEKKPLYYYLRDKGYIMTHCDQSISAIPADIHMARLLQTDELAPLLKFHNVVQNDIGETIMIQQNLFNANHYEYWISPAKELLNDLPHWRKQPELSPYSR